MFRGLGLEFRGLGLEFRGLGFRLEVWAPMGPQASRDPEVYSRDYKDPRVRAHTKGPCCQP